MSTLTASQLTWKDEQRAQRAMRRQRVLSIIRGGYGKITTRMIRKRTEYGERSVLRYLSDLRAEGLIEQVNPGHQPRRWKITGTGLSELSA